jgi:hypothetical protein
VLCACYASVKGVSVLACRHNPLNIFAAHEITGFADPSVATKMTVHFNLFGVRSLFSCAPACSALPGTQEPARMQGWASCMGS